ncbi:MAG: ribokinase [Muribaculaceae bacterium]|nr:ribokinase [Muribaculaceae bacterium]
MIPNKKPIIVIGSSNTDMVIRCSRLPRPGETVLGGSFMMNHGGKGANQAVAAAKLGGDTVFIGKVGDDVFGHQTVEMLTSLGIDTRFLGVSATEPSGVALINVDEHTAENSISVASGANGAIRPVDIDAAEEVIASASLILMQLEIPIDTVTYAAKMAKRHGVTVVLNPAPAPSEPLPEELLENVDIIIPNKTEAEVITGIAIDTPQDELRAIRSLHSKGISTVIFTLGSKGALLCQNGDCEEVPSFKVKAVDTTAAGDTFCGALCVGLSEGKEVRPAMIFANQAAAISVTRKGAQQSVPTRAEVDARFPN